MTTVKMIATKSLTYATRALEAGDPFEASERDSKLLRAVKKAKIDDTREGLVLSAPPEKVAKKIKAALKETTSPPKPAEPVPPPAEPETGADQGDDDAGDTGAADEITAVRAEYFEKLKKRPFMGWDVAELRKRIAEAPAS